MSHIAQFRLNGRRHRLPDQHSREAARSVIADERARLARGEEPSGSVRTVGSFEDDLGVGTPHDAILAVEEHRRRALREMPGAGAIRLAIAMIEQAIDDLTKPNVPKVHRASAVGWLFKGEAIPVLGRFGEACDVAGLDADTVREVLIERLERAAGETF